MPLQGRVDMSVLQKVHLWVQVLEAELGERRGRQPVEGEALRRARL
jgi:hypothetical protein